MNMFAILVETSSLMKSSQFLREFPDPKFHLNNFLMLLSCIFLYFEAEMNTFVTAAVMTCIVTFFLKKATNSIDIIRHKLGYNEAHFLHINNHLLYTNKTRFKKTWKVLLLKILEIVFCDLQQLAKFFHVVEGCQLEPQHSLYLIQPLFCSIIHNFNRVHKSFISW